MTAFFIPGLSDDTRVIEVAYTDMRRQVERDMGRRPTGRRILRLWTRREGVDCFTEVGRPDPLRGGIVMAIFDMGRHQPYIVWHQPDGHRDATREILRCNSYSVLEFDR